MKRRHVRPGLRCIALAGLGLAACEIARPAGAYTPDASDGFQSDQYGYGDAGDTDSPDELPPDDSSTAPDPTPPPVEDPMNPASPLQGRYLMRVDVYSTASVTRNGITVSTKNRVSNLLTAALALNGDKKLIARETLCHQSYHTDCLSNCSGWSTTVNPLVTKQYFPKQIVDREYSLDENGSLRVPKSVLALGFDEQPDLSALPNDPSDPRAWVVESPAGKVYGLNTLVEATVGPGALSIKLKCFVGAAQRFATAFSGKLDLTSDDALTKKAMRVDTTGTAGDTIKVFGDPADQCTAESLSAAGKDASEATTVVRFKRYDSVGCPASVAAYESQFAGQFDPPNASDLM